MTRRNVPIAAALLGCLAALLLLQPAGARAADGTDGPAAEQLAQRYAPFVVVREQAQACGPGEPYRPTQVTDVLGRQDVLLTTADGASSPAPTVGDLAGRGPDTYLNYPGDPLDPGCEYEQWSDLISADTPVTLYAHLATDPDHPGQLALQYWFFWVFNDWNNRHEGDWEMVQIVFDAQDAAQALTVSPTSVAFAQHEGSETSPWDDPKLQRSGDHPVVYPGEGSHAAYYNQANWFGKSAAAGFGCDDTSVNPEQRAVLWEPQIVLVPAQPVAGDAQFAWLTYEGHWGQQAPSFNNGPTGPNTKRQWTEPISWQLEEGRDGAVAIPAVPGPAVAAFCTLTTQGSLLFLQLLDRPLLTGGLIAAVVLIIVLLVRATRWRGADVTAYDRERQSGQLLGASLTIYARRWAVFAPIGAVFLLGTALVALLRAQILDFGQSGDLTDTMGATNAVPYLVAQLLSLAIQGPVVIIVLCASIAVVSRPHGEVGTAAALRRSIAPPGTALVLAGSYLVIVLLAATVLLAPVALWLASRWAAAGPAAMTEGLGFRAALRRSAGLTHQKRWRTLALTIFLFAVVLATGPVLGAALLLLTSWPFAVLNGLVALSYAVLLPVLGIALTLQFYDLRQEQQRDAAADEHQPAPVG